MFKRDNYKIAGHNICRISNGNGASLEIVPDLGAMIFQISLIDGNGQSTLILENDSDSELKENPWFRGRILFPFNDRIPNGKYSYKGRDFQLPINNAEDNSSIHGLVYNQPFNEEDIVLSEDKGEISFSYTINKTDYESYPFSVKLHVRYILSESHVSVQYTIINCDDQSLPVALGWHPYFSLNRKADTLMLQTVSSHYIAVDESLNPTGDILSARCSSLDFTESSLIGDQDLDLAFINKGEGISVLSDGVRQLKLCFDPDFFSFVQLFIPPGRQSIAIEPVTSATNSFNIPELGRIELQAHEKKSGLVTIHLS